MNTLNGFSKQFLEQLFYYDDGLLRRKITRTHNAVENDAVGSLDGKGYLHVSVSGSFLRVHRIIFFLLTGEVPKEVDHKDRNRLNNRIGNLRASDRKLNTGNTGLAKHNTSGLKGASLNSRSGKWHAQIKINGKQTYLGRFDTAEEAARCYDAAARIHFGEFAGTNYGN